MSRPARLEVDLKCLDLHRNNPYYKLGPFKYEPLNGQPHVGTFRDFLSKREMEEMKARARGKMETTPLVVQDKLQDFTKFRTSKESSTTESNVLFAARI